MSKLKLDAARRLFSEAHSVIGIWLRMTPAATHLFIHRFWPTPSCFLVNIVALVPASDKRGQHGFLHTVPK